MEIYQYSLLCICIYMVLLYMFPAVWVWWSVWSRLRQILHMWQFPAEAESANAGNAKRSRMVGTPTIYHLLDLPGYIIWAEKNAIIFV